MNTPHTREILREHLRDGTRGTYYEIAIQLGLEPAWCWRTLVDLVCIGDAVALPGERQPGQVGAVPKIYCASQALLHETGGTIVQRALASMPALQQVWMEGRR